MATDKDEDQDPEAHHAQGQLAADQRRQRDPLTRALNIVVSANRDRGVDLADLERLPFGSLRPEREEEPVNPGPTPTPAIA